MRLSVAKMKICKVYIFLQQEELLTSVSFFFLLFCFHLGSEEIGEEEVFYAEEAENSTIPFNAVLIFYTNHMVFYFFIFADWMYSIVRQKGIKMKLSAGKEGIQTLFPFSSLSPFPSVSEKGTIEKETTSTDDIGDGVEEGDKEMLQEIQKRISLILFQCSVQLRVKHWLANVNGTFLFFVLLFYFFNYFYF
jgi:hypothetical protein